jgi:hypothetical protein
MGLKTVKNAYILKRGKSKKKGRSGNCREKAEEKRGVKDIKLVGHKTETDNNSFEQIL